MYYKTKKNYRFNHNVNPNRKRIQVGDKIMVHAYKYNGWLYRTWHFPTVIYQDHEYIVLGSQGAMVSSEEGIGKRIFKSLVNKPTFWFLSKKWWFNLLVSVEKYGVKVYINIASPFIYEEGAIKYFDFDLDYKMFSSNKNDWKLLDLNEYLENMEKYKYPLTLRKKILATQEEIKQKIASGWFDKFIDNYLLTELYYRFKTTKRSDDEYEKEKYSKN